MNDVQQAWLDFRQLFIAAHHNPIARRRDGGEYAVACRDAFDRLDQLMKQSTGELMTPSQADAAKQLLGGVLGMMIPNPNWMEQAKEMGMVKTSTDPLDLGLGAMHQIEQKED